MRFAAFKNHFSLFFFLLLFGRASITASPIGNPSAPALIEQGLFVPDTIWTNVQSGATGDWLMSKRLSQGTSSKSLGLQKAEISGQSQIGNVTWNIAERLNIALDLGSGQFYWRWRQKGNAALTGRLAQGLIWSGSAKIVVFEIKDTSLAADAHAGGWDWMKGHANSNGVPLKDSVESKMRYWQLALAICQRISLCSPYIGFTANKTRLKIEKLESGVGWLNSRHNLGLFLGCTVSKGERIALNLEARGGFEQGATLSGQIRF